MRTFTDNAKRDWTVEINVSTVKRLRSAIGLDLMQALGGDVLERLASDPILLVDALYVTCKPQADERGVSDEEFGRALFGDCIEKAGEAFFAEVLDFFPQRQRQVLAKMLAKVEEAQDLAAGRAMKAIDGPDVAAAIERMLAKGEAEALSRLNALGR